ncbi:MAG: hypothetical protein DK305_000392 [Chloroflexi bacterium]|nr:MAG: hypothetical protein DK305_000392 [Chloroflexota bacterium]|tara:strand:- start:10493 stop:10660 length:168 start_codon:yes stop_codon:yes gene_type:complete
MTKLESPVKPIIKERSLEGTSIKKTADNKGIKNKDTSNMPSISFNVVSPFKVINN